MGSLGPVQLDFTVSEVKPISEGHSLISLCRGPIQYLYGEDPYKSPKMAKNRAVCDGCGSSAARAADTYRQKSLICQKKNRRLQRIPEVRFSRA
jgi:hypothetical protein